MGVSGGSASGAMDFPEYIKTFHEGWLGDAEAGYTSRVGSGSSPIWFGLSAADSSSYFTSAVSAIQSYQNLWNTVIDSGGANLSALWTEVLTSTSNDSGLTLNTFNSDALADIDDNFNEVTLPRFQAGMRDINAVVSSAFAQGRSNLESQLLRTKLMAVAKIDPQLKQLQLQDELNRLQRYEQHRMWLFTEMLQRSKDVALTQGELGRIRLVAQNEEDKVDREITRFNDWYPFEILQTSANMLGAPAGTAVSVKDYPSPFQEALGGALGGIAAGSSMGLPGMIGGGIVGLLGGLL